MLYFISKPNRTSVVATDFSQRFYRTIPVQLKKVLYYFVFVCLEVFTIHKQTRTIYFVYTNFSCFFFNFWLVRYMWTLHLLFATTHHTKRESWTLNTTAKLYKFCFHSFSFSLSLSLSLAPARASVNIK